MKFTIKAMLEFLEKEYTNDFGLQWNDTTCDWYGWLGYSNEHSFKSFVSDTLKDLLEKMVLSIENPKWGGKKL